MIRTLTDIDNPRRILASRHADLGLCHLICRQGYRSYHLLIDREFRIGQQLHAT